MPNFNVGDQVDLLDGGEIVAKATIHCADPNGTLHGAPIPPGHVSVSIVRVLRGDVYLPYTPAHEPDVCKLGQALGYYVAWPRMATAVCIATFCCSMYIAFFV